MRLTLSSLTTIFWISAGLVHLSGLGLVGFGIKPIGDCLLSVAVILGVWSGEIKPFSRSSIAKIAFVVSLLFVIACVWQIVFSVLLWGEPVGALRWGRRWLIFAIYCVVINSAVSKRLNGRTIAWAMIASCCIVTLVAFATDRGSINLTGVSSSSEVQGGVALTKLFIPGTSFLAFAVLLLYTLFVHEGKLKYAMLLVPALLSFVYVTRFRGWWLGMIMCMVLTSVISMRKHPDTLEVVGRSVAILLCIGLVAFAGSSLTRSRYEWLYSAYSEFSENSGNVRHRFTNDIARVESLQTRESPLFQLVGVGFVSPESPGYSRLGFSSESNDSGWVEVFLTSGYFGCAAIALLWVCTLLRFIGDAGLRLGPRIAAFSGLAFVVLTLGNSNLLLWDVGFVPLMWLLAICASLTKASPCN